MLKVLTFLINPFAATFFTSRTKAELLRQQEMEIKELRRKHEEAQRAIMEESIKDMETENGEDEMGLLKALREVDHNQSWSSQHGAQRSRSVLVDTQGLLLVDERDATSFRYSLLGLGESCQPSPDLRRHQ